MATYSYDFFANKLAFSLPLMTVYRGNQNSATLFPLHRLFTPLKHFQTNLALMIFELSEIMATCMYIGENCNALLPIVPVRMKKKIFFPSMIIEIEFQRRLV